MKLPAFPFSITDFADIEPEIKKGVTGYAEWRVLFRDTIRIRLVTYSPGYMADHWCEKGHIIFCVEGQMETELKDGSKHLLTANSVYTVGDDSDAHCSATQTGCTLFIVD